MLVDHGLFIGLHMLYIYLMNNCLMIMSMSNFYLKYEKQKNHVKSIFFSICDFLNRCQHPNGGFGGM